MNIKKNIVAGINENLPILLDLFTPESKSKVPVVLFFHGTKGFKDWGFWPHMYMHFNQAGLALINVNFSHNGVVISNTHDITSANDYRKNTIAKELDDMRTVLDWVFENADNFNLDTDFITLCGHSRGGAEVFIYASTDKRVSKVVAWSPVADLFAAYSSYDLQEWERKGSITIENARTGMELPIDFSFAKDILDHSAEYNVINAASLLEIPVLLVHGTVDESVNIENSRNIHSKCLHAMLISLQHANHTFGTSHPWNTLNPLPREMVQLLENSIEFILD